MMMMMMMMKGKNMNMNIWSMILVVLGMILVVLGGSSVDCSSNNKDKWRKSLTSGIPPPPPGYSSSSLLLQTRGASSSSSSSIVLPLHGNVYPNGFYNVTLFVGDPPKPYFMDVDTGSDLTWLQCDAPCVQCVQAPHPLYVPSNNRVACRDPLCASLHPSGDYRCDTLDQCDYEVEYADGGSSLGVLLNDLFQFNFTNGKRLSPLLALGCGYDQVSGPSGSSHPIDGLLGLGKGKASIITQLSGQGLVRNVIGHCLSSHGGGFLFFGDGTYDPSRVTWTPMSQDYTKHYSPGLAELTFGGKATGLRNLQVAFDSGSSYSYLSAPAYQALVSLVTKELSGRSLREAPEDKTLPVCWKGRKPFKSVRDVKKYFKPWALSFAAGGKAKTLFEIQPEDYLIISLKGNACLGILNGTEVGLGGLNLIGDVSMQDKMVIYENEKQMIGWVVRANCDRLPKSNTLNFII